MLLHRNKKELDRIQRTIEELLVFERLLKAKRIPISSPAASVTQNFSNGVD